MFIILHVTARNRAHLFSAATIFILNFPKKFNLKKLYLQIRE